MNARGSCSARGQALARRYPMRRTGRVRRALGACADAASRLAFRVVLRHSLMREYGGAAANERYCSVYWIGARAPDIVAMATQCDALMRGAAEILRADLGACVRRLPKVSVVVAEASSSIVDVVRRLPGRAQDEIKEPSRPVCLVPERAIVLHEDRDSAEFRLDIAWSLFWLLREVCFRAPGERPPLARGYALFFATKLCSPGTLGHPATLAHLVSALEGGRCLALRDALTTDYQESYYGGRAHNEQLYHFVRYLYSQRGQSKRCWEAVCLSVTGALCRPEDTVACVEAATDRTIQDLDVAFASWCNSQLAGGEGEG